MSDRYKTVLAVEIIYLMLIWLSGYDGWFERSGSNVAIVVCGSLSLGFTYICPIFNKDGKFKF